MNHFLRGRIDAAHSQRRGILPWPATPSMTANAGSLRGAAHLIGPGRPAAIPATVTHTPRTSRGRTRVMSRSMRTVKTTEKIGIDAMMGPTTLTSAFDDGEVVEELVARVQHTDHNDGHDRPARGPSRTAQAGRCISSCR